jgi:maltose O-acetyltransferase
MKSRLNRFLFENPTRMRIFNHLFVYIIHLAHMLLNVMPGPIRNLGFRLLLARVGRNTFFDYNVYVKFPWLVEIGDEVSINRGVEFYPEFKGDHKIVIGNDVRIAPHVRFYAAGHDLSDVAQHVGGTIIVEDHVWIGAQAIILPGVVIGHDTIIGAGSVVTDDIPPRSIAVGVPAQVIKTRQTPQ